MTMKATAVAKASASLTGEDRISSLLNRASIGIVTTAILVLVTLTAVEKKAVDEPLRSAVRSYFFAAALGGGGVLFDALIDSIVIGDARSTRVRWYNRIAWTGSVFWLAGAVLAWIAGSAALADHYGIGHIEQLWLLCFVLAPFALGMVIALTHSVFLLIDRHSTGRKPSVKRAPRASR
jgi:hypothetical protein